ncbi:MAG: phospholipid carrier-dependent glycosyltransferase [Caldilineaceae bacterium]
MLATPIFWLTQGNLLALRFFNLLLGALGLWLLYAGVATVFPNKTLISGGALAFAALLPMQIAVAAAVNNDVLAQVMVVAAMYVLLRWMRTQFHGTAALDSRQSTMMLILLGFLLGLGMVTKIYAYLVLPVAVATVVLVAWLRPRVGRPLRGLEWSQLRRSIARRSGSSHRR